MIQQIDRRLLDELSSHTRRLGVKRSFQSMGYERCGELPLIVSRLEPMFPRKLRYLDIGSGDSAFPTYILTKTGWEVTCIDRFSSVRKQHVYARRTMNDIGYQGRFHVLEQDFLDADLPAESFDIITNISVIEHFEGNTDSLAMAKSSKLLKGGGLYFLTTLINDGYFKEFFLNTNVYGRKHENQPVFYQRHYDLPLFERRIVQASGLKEIERVYLGEYGFKFGERFMSVPWPWKPLKIFYQWAAPFFARWFITYRDYPVSRAEMHMFTTSCIFIVLQK